jgi:hypothetical protein
MKPLFVFAADLHLSKLVWSGRPDIADDSYRAMSQVVDTALRHRVPLVLGGDLFDKRKPDSESVAVAYENLERMARENLPVYFNQGQHDMADPPWLTIHPWPKHIHKQSFELAGYQFYGLDWQPAGVLQTELAQIPPRTTFLVAHQVWKEHMGGIGNPEGSVSEVPHALFLLTGDYHHTQITEWPNANGQKMSVVSPGSTHMRAIDEPAQKSCYLFSRQPDGKVVITAEPLATRPYYEVRINNEFELLSFCQDANTKLPPPAVEPSDKLLLRVSYAMEIPEVSARIRQAVSNRAHLFENPHSEQSGVLVTSTGTAEQTQQISVESAIDRLAESPDLNLAGKQIWSAPDVPTALQAMFAAFR